MFNEVCCLLCLETSKHPIELDSQQGHTRNSKEIIELHFKKILMISQIEMRVVCGKCWQMVEPFHEFYLQVLQAHKNVANTLKNSTLDQEFSEIKEEQHEHDDTKMSTPPSPPPPQPAPPQRRRGRPRRQRNNDDDLVNVYCDQTLPALKECQVKIEDLMLPATIADTKDINSPTQPDMFVASPTALKTKDESEMEKMDEVFMDTNTLPTGASESAEETDSEKNTMKARRVQKKSKKLNVKEQKQKTMKTAESDKFIAKKNFKFSCCLCHVPLANFRELKKHFRVVHQTMGYVLCCGKKLPERGVLVDHLNFHENPDYFKCKICGKTLTERRGLDLHLRYGHGKRERVYRCSICSKSFFRASCLKQHRITHLGEDEKTVPCSKCEKTFPDECELRKHMRHTHLNAYAKICDICGISIRGRFAFEQHQAEHAGVPRKLIKCDLCDAVLTTKYGLARHMKTMHTEEYRTPQVCPICSKVSPSLQAHRNHIKFMHSLERKHACSLCDKAFKRITDYKEHVATHTGEALYTCDFCPQTFKSNANMYAHRKKKHPKEWAELCASKKSLAVSSKEASISAVQ